MRFVLIMINTFFSEYSFVVTIFLFFSKTRKSFLHIFTTRSIHYTILSNKITPNALIPFYIFSPPCAPICSQSLSFLSTFPLVLFSLSFPLLLLFSLSSVRGIGNPNRERRSFALCRNPFMLYVHRREITVILSSAASTSFPHLISFYFPTFARLAKRLVSKAGDNYSRGWEDF